MRKFNNKTTAILFVAVLSATTALSGCGKKKIDYDVEDGQETDNDGDGAGLAARLGIPESYEGDLEVGSSGLDSIKIDDDDIITPSTDSMSVVSFTKNTIDNEYKQQVCEAIFDQSQGIYEYDWEHMTKDDIQVQIDMYNQIVEEGTASGDEDTVEYAQEYIDYLNEEMENAVDERSGAGDYSGTDFIGYIGQNQYMISFSDSDDSLGASFDLSYYPYETMINYRPCEGAVYVYAYDSIYGDDGYDDSIPNECTLSKDDAAELAKQFLDDCGIDDVIQTNISDLLWEYYDSSYEVVSTAYDGYIVTFERSINGTAPYSADLSMVDTLEDESVWSNTETFTLNIDDSGVISASCYPLLKATGEEEKNVSLLTWDEILKSLNENLPTYYAEHTTSYSDITFNDVRLTYYKIPDASTEDAYTYTPVWIFAEAEKYDGEYDYDYPVQAVMVNAMDGSIIELTDVLEDESDYYDDYLDLDDYDIEYDDDYDYDDEDYDDEDYDVDIEDSDDESIVFDDSDIEYEESDDEDDFGLEDDSDDDSDSDVE
jgi:hypothetical protein